ncbi:MAG: hypothetical protein AMJ78_08790 [Omnitrophica WOR_2 bacterium SM23_29]|nr:MAG: hypothetical protein AMJ78_08790 [Omnitrophica WOR_2 bacterium SM23_29]
MRKQRLGQNTEISGAVKAIRNTVWNEKFIMRKLFLVTFLVLFLGVSNCVFAQEQTETVLWDGMETEDYWSIATWGDRGELSLSAEQKTEGQNSLKVTFGPEGKQTPSKGIVLEKEQTAVDIDSTEKVILDIYNDGLPFDLALVLYTDEFCESSPKRIEIGLNKDVVFDLSAADFKSPTSNWEYNYTLRPGTVAWRVMFIIYPDEGVSGSVYFDNIRVEKLPRIKSPQNVIPVEDYTPPEITSIRPEKEIVEQYEKFELIVDFEGTYQYPYDPRDIDLTAVFISPANKEFRVPGFLYSGIVDGVNIKDAVWKIRFTPHVAGVWVYYVTVENPKGIDESQFFSFESLPVAKKGFVRVSKENPIYFEFDNGEFYYPLGQNVAWASSLEAYDHYFSKMRENKYNWSRVWMSGWQCAIEWLDVGYFHGLNNYNLENAKLLDDIFALAQEYDIYLQLVLNTHGQLSTKEDPEWLNNPYNAVNGGPCEEPNEFFTNEEAKELFKYRMRYIVARWGYLTNLMGWELWNEVTLTDNYNSEADIAWHEEMARYTKELDPYQHLITTSYFGNFSGGIWELPEIDYSQIHMYTPEIVTTLDGLHQIMEEYHKPYLVGEFGASNLSGVDREDPNATAQHAGIWAQYMTMSAGNAMAWEWDNYIEAYDLYYHWLSLAKFNEGEDRRNVNYNYSRATIEIDENTTLMTQGILNDRRALLWIYDLSHTKYGQGDLNPLSVENANISLMGMVDGEYRIEFWDTYTGEISQVLEISCQDSELKIPLIHITTDVACKALLQKAKTERSRKVNRGPQSSPYIASNYLSKDTSLLPRELWESFEISNDWHTTEWGDEASVSLTRRKATEGRKSLQITFNKQGRRMDGKGIAVQRQNISLDLSKAEKMVFDVYLDAPNSIEVSVVLNSLGFCESVRKLIVPGWNINVTFDLTAKTFKKASTNWMHKAEIDRDV